MTGWQAPASKPLPTRALLIGGAIVLVALAAFGMRGTSAGPARQQVTVTGSGISQSRPIELRGDYRVDWTATASTHVGCYHGASLRETSGGRGEFMVNEMVDGTRSGTTYLYGLASGRYYVDASSGCQWSFVFVPA